MPDAIVENFEEITKIISVVNEKIIEIESN